MKKIFFSGVIVILSSHIVNAQGEKYRSINYSYTLLVPSNFSKIASTSPNMDLQFSSTDGSSINIVVRPLTSAFNGKTPHDLTKEMILNMFRKVDPAVKIEEVGYPVLNGKKSFKYIIVFTPPNEPFTLKQLQYTFFNDGKSFVLTMSAGINFFINHRKNFISTANSIEF
ncbi:hypothetical protein [Fodinibius salsisoli]|uniref:DUF1795 domain-containing protein n=1 Tax=Fodinibius salsisoli TaxID=2820877 RepID=A0ABT3PIP7_9BACT|nr:hypothetical protein [Fodinibius salsisoli]MCW9705792.1 hypothetical protein [Fodinibius salsisoli]